MTAAPLTPDQMNALQALDRARAWASGEVERKRIRMHKGGWVYVLRCADTDRYKIGWTGESPHRRARSIAHAAGLDVSVVAYWPGTRADEMAIHRAFAADRLRGEWFQPSPAIDQWVNETPHQNVPTVAAKTTEFPFVSGGGR